MKKFISWIKDEESGQGMVEYGLIIVFVALVAVVGLKVLGVDIGGFFDGIADNF